MPSQIGREEERLAAALKARGHDVIPQKRVYKDNEYGWFDIDLAMPPVGIEVQTDLETPWKRGSALHRRSGWLIHAKGWRIIYLWLPRGAVFTENAVDAILRFKLDVATGSDHSYRCINHDGKLLQVGWVSQLGTLVSGPPEEIEQPLSQSEREQAYPIGPWSPEPPEPPSVVNPDAYQGPKPLFPDDDEPKLTLEEENEHRRLWWLYEQNFKAWAEERERRKEPWEVLPRVEMARSPRRPRWTPEPIELTDPPEPPGEDEAPEDLQGR